MSEGKGDLEVLKKWHCLNRRFESLGLSLDHELTLWTKWFPRAELDAEALRRPSGETDGEGAAVRFRVASFQSLGEADSWQSGASAMRALYGARVPEEWWRESGRGRTDETLEERCSNQIQR